MNHQEPDKLPVDFGSNTLSGMHVSTVYKLRQYYGLDRPGTPVRVHKIFVMTGVIEDDLKEILGSDCVVPEDEYNSFGIPNTEFKEWQLHDGTPVLVPKLFNTDKNPDGSVYQYPGGNKQLGPSAVMPDKGFFFDAIERKKGVDETTLDPLENVEEYTRLTDSSLKFLYDDIKRLYETTTYAINYEIPETNLGDVATIPGTGLANPQGIRDIEEWYISLHTRKNYVKKMFEAQIDIAMDNLKRLAEQFGDMLDFVVVASADFGFQTGLMFPLKSYRELFKPFHTQVNRYIHENTNWKTFIHTCGAVSELIPDLIEAEFDILNPVQISAAGMEPQKLKKEFGKDIVFHGGAVDTQKTLPFGTPDEVKEEAKRLIEIFAPGGGFIADAVHIIQGNVPIENVVALIETFNEYR